MLNLKPIGPYKTSFLVALIWLILLVVFFNNYSAQVVGRFLGLVLLSAGITGAFAKRAKTAWNLLRYNAVFLLVLAAFFMLTSVGAAKPA
jgi:hypothetical protein